MHADHSRTSLAAPTLVRPDEDMLPLLRWLIIGVAVLALAILAITRAGAVGAAAPADCIAINYTTCISNGVYYTNGNPTATVATAYTYPYAYGNPYIYVAPSYVTPSNYTPTSGSYLVSSYPDPRYCGGVVNVWNEGGNLIDRCPDGTRVYPVFPDYGYGYGGYVAPFYGGYYNNYYGNYYNAYYNGYYSGVQYCDPSAWWCLNYQATGDPFNGPYKAKEVTSDPSATTANSGTSYRVSQVTQPTTTQQTAPAPAQVTAPVQMAAPAPAAPAAQTATGLNAASQTQTVSAAAAGGSGVKILSVQQPMTNHVTATTDRDDSR